MSEFVKLKSNKKQKPSATGGFLKSKKKKAKIWSPDLSGRFFKKQKAKSKNMEPLFKIKS